MFISYMFTICSIVTVHCPLSKQYLTNSSSDFHDIQRSYSALAKLVRF